MRVHEFSDACIRTTHAVRSAERRSHPSIAIPARSSNAHSGGHVMASTAPARVFRVS